jgi:hypothetical protein
MRTRKLRTIARRWWRADGGNYDWDRVDRILTGRHDLVPRLLKALVETAPEGEVRYLGPAIIETLEMNIEFGLRHGPSRTLQMVNAAGLRQNQIIEVLSGAYSSYLMTMNISEVLADVLSPDEIHWLLDESAPVRFEYPFESNNVGQRVPRACPNSCLSV